MRLIRYIFYHAKASLKKRHTWVLIATIILLIFTYSGITVPSVDNTKVGIITRGSSRAEMILENMERRTTLYEFVKYDDVDALLEDVSDGTLECAFIFADDYDRLFDKKKFRDSIEYVSSPYTTKGLVAKETFYSAFLENYSNEILLSEYNDMFGSNDESLKEEIAEMLKDRNSYYISGNEIFEVDFKDDFK